MNELTPQPIPKPTPEFDPHTPPDVAMVFIKNENNQFFLHQRKLTKRVNPGLWGIGAGGYIDDGEDPLQAAKREVFEETDIKIEKAEELTYLFVTDYTEPYNGTSRSYSISVFELCVGADKEIPIDEKEWQDGGFIDAREVTKLYKNGALSPDTAFAYEIYRGYRELASNID